MHPRACHNMPVELRGQLSEVGLRDRLGPSGFVVSTLTTEQSPALSTCLWYLNALNFLFWFLKSFLLPFKPRMSFSLDYLSLVLCASLLSCWKVCSFLNNSCVLAEICFVSFRFCPYYILEYTVLLGVVAHSCSQSYHLEGKRQEEFRNWRAGWAA